MPLILGTNSIKDEGYEVDNSLRFNDGSSDYLSKTLGTPTNNKKWTWSSWLKRSTISNDQHTFFSAGTDYNMLQFATADTIQIEFDDSDNYRVRSNRLFRDVSAWYHIVVAVDTTQATASNRMKFYVNGVQETSFSTANYPPLNYDTPINSATEHNIGRRITDTSKFYDGYMAEIVFIDGQQLDPTSFGEFDEDSGIWKPIDVSGLTFGTNGFYLDFENSGSLGADVSGNGNNFTVNNLTSVDQSTDTPTLNYATLNAVLPSHSSTFSEGNCKWTPSTASEYYWSNSNFGLSQGKWYMEAKLTTAAGHNYFGISIDQPDDSTTFLGGGGGIGGANDQYEWSWKSSDGKIYNNTDGGTAYGDTYTTGDILGLYLDLDNNKLYFAKNGTIQNSGTGISITDPASTPNGFYFIAVGDGTSSNSSVWEANFGNPTFSISSGNSDPNGYGNFEYSPNDGGSASFDSSAKDFYALNTKNLAEYG